MRVLLTTDTIGGVWTFTRELASELLHRGHTVALVSFGRDPSPSQQAWAVATALRFAETFSFTPSPAPLEWMPDNDRAYDEGAAVLAEILRTVQPDLLHFNQLCFGALPTCTPKLVTAHSDVLSWAAACRATPANPRGLEPSAWLTQYLDLVEAGLAGAQAVTTPTRWMAAQLSHHLPFGPVPHPILNGRTLTPCTDPPKRWLQAVSAGRLWDEAKNVTLLTRIDSPMPILIAGDQQLAGAQIQPPPTTLSAQLTFTGALAEQDLLELLRQSSVYIATSVYEPFGLAPLEAALCGCAVLAHDLESLREVWGDAALYFHDAASLEFLLHQLVAEPTQLQAAQQRAETRALALTAARMTDAYLALYECLLNSPVETAPCGSHSGAAHEEATAHAI